ncbi:MAG TPA: RIP metalloprotease RseP [Vicinamibacteria bacterium]|jgi:regulator of sigma E protease|nr:RIP metalloprotease RseP [Vicinamibacteria bacterium]
MTLFTDLWAFVLVLAIIIFVHEFGHFITAKAFGMRVFIFSFGFGPRLFGVKKGDTDYRLSLIPLGGYVKLEGEPDDHLSPEAAPRGDGRDFAERPRWQRFLTYLAGPVMNVVLTVLVFSILYTVGFGVPGELYDRPVIGWVQQDSPAAGAGLKPGDEILTINGERQGTWEDALSTILLRPDTDLRVRFVRGGESQETLVHSRATSQKAGDIGVYPLVRVGEVVPKNPASRAGVQNDDGILEIDGSPVRSFDDIPPLLHRAEGKAVRLSIFRAGQILEIPVTPEGGRIGIANKYVFKKLAPIPAVKEAWQSTVHLSVQTVVMLSDLIRGRVAPKAALTGPVGIAQASGRAARNGYRDVLNLVAVLSISVGLLNLFPLAPLDGGHLAILAGEGLLRRDFSTAAKTWIMNAGAMVLLALVALVLYSDLSKTSLLGRYLR